MTKNSGQRDPVQRLAALALASWKGEYLQVSGAWIPPSGIWWIRKSVRINRFYENFVRLSQACVLTSANALKKTLRSLESSGAISATERRGLKNAVKAVLRVNTDALIEGALLAILGLLVAGAAAFTVSLLTIKPVLAAIGFGLLAAVLTVMVIACYNGLAASARNAIVARRLLLVLYLIFGLNGVFTILTQSDDSVSLSALVTVISAAVGVYLIFTVLTSALASFRLRRRVGEQWRLAASYHVLHIIHCATEHAEAWNTADVQDAVRINLDEVRELTTRYLGKHISGSIPGGRPAALEFSRSVSARLIELKAELMRSSSRTTILSSADQYLSNILRNAWLELPTADVVAFRRRRSASQTVRSLLGALGSVAIVWAFQKFQVVPGESAGWIWTAVLLYAAFTTVSLIDPRLEERLQAFLKIGSSVRSLREGRSEEE